MRVNWLWNKCGRWSSRLSLMATDALPERELGKMKAHLRVCSACRLRLEDLQRLNTELKGLGNALPQAAPSDALSGRWQNVILRESRAGAKRQKPGWGFPPASWLDAWFAGGRFAWAAAAACWVVIIALRISAPEAPKAASIVRPVSWKELVAVLDNGSQSLSPSFAVPKENHHSKPVDPAPLPRSEGLNRTEKV